MTTEQTRPANAGTPAIVARDLSRKFGKSYALRGIDLTVEQGEIFAFLGPNGAGKSTLVRILTTLLSPTAGTADILGMDINKNRNQIKLDIGVALQELSLDAKQTGYELLVLQGRLYGLSAADIKLRISQLEPMIDIGDALKRYTRTYSGGMKRRLDLAVAMMHQPKVLFLDEPTTGLDPISRKRVWEQVRDINHDFGVTVFLTTQYLEEADELADRVAIINGGKIVLSGTPEALKKGIGSDIIVVKVAPADAAKGLEMGQKIDGVEQVQLVGETELSFNVKNGPAMISKIATAMSGSNLTIDSITLRQPTLDDVFLRATGERLEDWPSDSAEEENSGD